MKLRIWKKCDCCTGANDENYECGGFDYLVFQSKVFQFRWFYDNGYRFLYIHLGERYWRFGG